MKKGGQKFPHTYIKRVWANNKWEYSYPEIGGKKLMKAPEGTQEYKVVIAHGRPTSILVHPTNSTIIFGPPQTIGKTLFINTNPKKDYFGVARSADVAIYMYPEEFLQNIEAKKAAKFLKAGDALTLIDNTAEQMMVSSDREAQEYGLAMWLNNNSGIRIGAHESAASVDSKERRAIINQARVGKWTDHDKAVALEQARTPTFGLLTLRAGHVTIDYDKRLAMFNFRGKGGKMMTGENITVPLPPTVFTVFHQMLSSRRPDEKIFNNVSYKKVWRYYQKYGVTPHISRGQKANEMMKALMKKYKGQGDSGEQAWRNFQHDVQTKISDKLGHSAAMTQKAYIAPTTKNALEEFHRQLLEHQKAVVESESGISVGDFLPELARVVTWMEIGPGNEVV